MSSRGGDVVRVRGGVIRRPSGATRARTDIDRMSTLDVLRTINAEDRRVPDAVAAVLPELARAVDLAVEALRGGDRVHYVGAGTSGRLATLDAAELAPTFNIPPDWFVAHHAGGADALRGPWRTPRTTTDGGAAEIRRRVAPGDFVLGLTASGRTPYVARRAAGGPRAGRAHRCWCRTTRTPPRRSRSTCSSRVDTGPEAIAGSTRMKAGTSQKLVLTVVLHRGDGEARPHVLEPDGQHARHQREAARPDRRGSCARPPGWPSRSAPTRWPTRDGDLKVALVHLLSGATIAHARPRRWSAPRATYARLSWSHGRTG